MLYIHIPFCDSKCFYCSFNSYSDSNHLIESYLEALKKDLINSLKNRNITFNSIFIGGGTPSVINAKEYEELFLILKPFIDDKTEITIEANPNSATYEWLSFMKNFVNRISFGIQSFDDKKLKFLGRVHNKEIAMKALQFAKELNYQNISIDLIYGCLGDNLDLLFNDLKIAKSFDIQHISAYSLTIEENTKFFGKNVAFEDIDLAKSFCQKIEEFGFKQYEISNFGIKSKHNYGYWEGRDYIGVGCGAVGFAKNMRFYTNNSIFEYIKEPTFRNIEELNEKALKLEKIFLGFRSDLGVALDIFSQKELDKINILERESKVSVKNGKVYNLELFLADELTIFITEVL